MGTVGLSFGSPTSGAGFNVSTTVAAIVSNLQAVESPWKTQLTDLQSQDKAISSLGTLFSKLSSDMSALTDFQGVLAQKTGSSSDNNVVQLTAASSSATAGTHSVVVNNLARTSSGYMDAITSGADKLSGSITLQVGAGAAQTITLGANNNTLVGLAAAINSSGAGVTASVLTDSSGSRLSLVSGTSGAGGNIQVSGNSIVDTTNANKALAYNPTMTGLDASMTVDGVGLTSASNLVANLIPGVTFQLLAPSAKLSDGSLEQVQVVIANDNASVETTVNGMVADYNALISAISTQEGNDSAGNPQPLFGSPTLSLLQQQLLGGLNAQNPNGYLDGIKNSADTLSGSISIQVGSGTAQVVTLDSTDNTLAGLASAINGKGIGVMANVVTDSTGSRLVLVSNTSGANGALKVSSSVTDATTGTALNYNGGGSDINSLATLGISLGNNGTLSLNLATLTSVLNTDFAGVAGFFQNANSWGQSFSTTLNTAGNSSATGILSLAAKANSSIESTLNANITKEESLISIKQKSLTLELNSANEIMQALPTQLSGINELYSAITGYNQNLNG